MMAFIDKRCPNGHRYGWAGDPSQDPGCSKCAAVTLRRTPESTRAVETVPGWFSEFVTKVQGQQGGIDREAALRSIMRKWGVP